MFIVTVTWKAKLDQADAFRACLIQQATNSLKLEENCEQFDVAEDPSDPTRFFLYEVYAEPVDFETHLKSKHFLDFAAVTAPMVEDKIVETFHRFSPQP